MIWLGRILDSDLKSGSDCIVLWGLGRSLHHREGESWGFELDMRSSGGGERRMKWRNLVWMSKRQAAGLSIWGWIKICWESGQEGASWTDRQHLEKGGRPWLHPAWLHIQLLGSPGRRHRGGEASTERSDLLKKRKKNARLMWLADLQLQVSARSKPQYACR